MIEELPQYQKMAHIPYVVQVPGTTAEIRPNHMYIFEEPMNGYASITVTKTQDVTSSNQEDETAHYYFKFHFDTTNDINPNFQLKLNGFSARWSQGYAPVFDEAAKGMAFEISIIGNNALWAQFLI